jgi:hypothetical protein
MSKNPSLNQNAKSYGTVEAVATSPLEARILTPDESSPATKGEDTVAEIDQIVGHWSDLRQEGVERQAQEGAAREQFLEDFRHITDSVIRPAMAAAVERLRMNGGGELIEERKEDLMHRTRVILWMSLDGTIAGTPRQDRNPYLQLDADVGHRWIDVWEGDMWEKEGTSRATSPWELDEVSSESVTKRILDILRRAATHGVAA